MNVEQNPSDPRYPHQGAVTPEIVQQGRGSQASPPPQIIIQQSGGGFLRFVSLLGWFGLMLCIPIILTLFATRREYFDTSKGVQEKYHSLSKSAKNKIGIVDVSGIITTGEDVRRQIDRVRKDKNVKAVVVRINSPGGTVTGSDFILHHLSKLKEERELPLVVSMGSIAASGGYYVAMAVGDEQESIYAEPTSTTGSIGVIIPHYDISGLMERLDVKNDSIASHPRKQMLSMTKKLTDDDRQLLSEYVGESFDRFKQIVQGGRPEFQESPEKLEEIATGEIFSAGKALANGLVDRIGFIEDAVSRAVELAGLSEDEVRVVRYSRIPTLMDAFGMGQARSSHLLPFELGVPRALYLATTLPPLLRSEWQ